MGKGIEQLPRQHPVKTFGFAEPPERVEIICTLRVCRIFFTAVKRLQKFPEQKQYLSAGTFQYPARRRGTEQNLEISALNGSGIYFFRHKSYIRSMTALAKPEQLTSVALSAKRARS